MRQEIKSILNYCRFLVCESDFRPMWIHLLIYYAQYLSIEEDKKPIVWSRFHNVNGIPYLSALLVESEVDYSETEWFHDEDPSCATHIINAYETLREIYKELGFDGVREFVMGICDIQGIPSVDPYHMLYYTLKSKDKQDRIIAKQLMQKDEKERDSKTIKTQNENGEEIEEYISKYI